MSLCPIFNAKFLPTAIIDVRRSAF